MSALKVVSIVLLALGIAVLVALVTLGGVAKQTITDTVMNRLKYKLPKGAKGDPDFQQCYRSTKASFDEEYYLWNLTNPTEFLDGSIPHFEVVGPFAYTQWYCNYDLSTNEDTGYLTYRTVYEGYRFLRDDSVADDSINITNFNPAYLGLLQTLQKSVGQDDLAVLLSQAGTALKTIILQMQAQLQSPSNLLAVWVTAGMPAYLAGMNAGIISSTRVQVTAGALNGLNETQFFEEGFITTNGIQGFTEYTLRQNPTANVNLSANSSALIFAAWSNPVSLASFIAMDLTTIAYQFGLNDTSQAALLTQYIAYLRNSDPITAGTLSTVYGQWANGTQSTFYDGWEAGIPTATGISFDDVSALFNPSGDCSFTNNGANGIRRWLVLMQSPTATLANTCPGVFSMSEDQAAMLKLWIQSYAGKFVGPYLLGIFEIPSWDKFALQQWGSNVLKQSINNTANIPFAPEYGVYEPRVLINYAVAEAALNGSVPLFNDTNMQLFLGLVNKVGQGDANALGQLNALWPNITSGGVTFITLASYVRDIVAYQAVLRDLQAKYLNLDQGGGLVTRRSVREWLFTAQDPLLAAFGQPNSVPLVGNLTRTKEEANQRNYTYVRIYTGKNDLHWSLMPYNEGDNIPYWNGTMHVTGYNGSQFLPNGYLDKEPINPPLVLFHRLINRTINFQVVGKDKWDGVDVRYLTLDDHALDSRFEDPANELYYANYHGVINKTSNPPYLPVFLTTPNFLSAEKSFYANVTFNDTIFNNTYNPNTDKLSRDRLAMFLLVEPTLGSSLWGNLPIQVNFGFRPTSIYNKIIPGFAPIYWNAIGDKATPNDLKQVKTLYTGRVLWKVFIGVGVGAGVVLIVAGIVGLVYYRKQKGIKIRP